MIKIIKASDLQSENEAKKISVNAEVTDTVRAIIAGIRERGDEALREYTKKFDGCKLKTFELDRADMDEAIRAADPEFVEILRQAARNIDEYHRNQIRAGFDLMPKDGVILGQKFTPIAKAACYIPGGTASLPSSVLMNVIPAKIAGVREVIIATPPPVSTNILAAAKIAGADRVFSIGGAQAIAALAYGTETIPRVDKITGPGNAYVTEAKRQLYGVVGIDMLAGPSDILIIADKTANSKHIAADMLSQCEHGSDSFAILITDSMTLAKKVRAELNTQLASLPRKSIAQEAINKNSTIIISSTIDEAFDISNNRAPEHLAIHLDEPFSHLNKVINAGSIFLGKYTPETAGDYMAGPNHTIPTNGTARFSSPLSVDDFVKKSSYIHYCQEALENSGKAIMRYAREEGLEAHARAVQIRLDDYKD
ncbi:MAG: histidinol dehydrogenase [Oscillospiraceae bacterium]|nr:histidinol dehydrogenase [Oscillospiraceae bacterium]